MASTEPRRRYHPRRRHARRPWPELPADIVDVIIRRLPLASRRAFSQVCKPWRSSFLELGHRRPTRPPPYLMLVGPFVTGLLLSLHGYRVLKIPSPRPYIPSTHRIIGASKSWLVTASLTEPVLNLLNYATHQLIPLPSITSGGATLSPSAFGNSCFTVEHVDIMHSDDHCILVARGHRQGAGCVFASCRPGDREWAEFMDDRWQDRRVRNLRTVFYKGELYMIGYEGYIMLYKFDQLLLGTMKAISGLVDRLPCTRLKRHWPKRFVEAGEELFVVVWQDSDVVDESWCRGAKLDVFKLEGGKWVQVKTLDDRVLLFGIHGAEALCGEKVVKSGLERNCVYYHSRMAGSILYYDEGELVKADSVVKFRLAGRKQEVIHLPSDSMPMLGFEWIAGL